MKLLDWILIALVIGAVIAAIIVWRKNKNSSCSSSGCSGDCMKCASSANCALETENVDRHVDTIKQEDTVTLAFEPSEEMQPIDPDQSRTTEEYLEFLQRQVESGEGNI